MALRPQGCSAGTLQALKPPIASIQQRLVAFTVGL